MYISLKLFCQSTNWEKLCFDYNCQNPSHFLFLMRIRAIVIETPLRIKNLNKKKTKGTLVVVVNDDIVQICYCDNQLELIVIDFEVESVLKFFKGLNLVSHLWSRSHDLLTFPKQTFFPLARGIHRMFNSLLRKPWIKCHRAYVLHFIILTLTWMSEYVNLVTDTDAR